MRPPEDPTADDPLAAWGAEHPDLTVTIHTDLHGARHMRTVAGHVRIVDAHRMAAVRLARSGALAACAVCLIVNDTKGVDLPARVHIVDTTDTSSVLTDHDAGSPDWARALIASPLHAPWEPHEAQVLATEIANRAKRAGKHRISASGSPSPLQSLSTLQAAELREIAALTETAGLPLMTPATQRNLPKTPPLHLRDLPGTTQATVSPRGVLIHAGTLLEDLDPGGTHIVEIGCRRTALLQMEVLRGTGRQLEFARDHLIENPSYAAALIRGRPTNGWSSWQDVAGSPLRVLI